MKAKLVTCFAVATLAGASASAHAAEPAATAARVHKGQGTVKKVEMEAANVNLAHGAIPSLNWPAMTMDYQVKQQAILKDIKPGAPRGEKSTAECGASPAAVGSW